MKKGRTKVIVFLHIVLMIYSLLGICSKLAAGEEFLSVRFIFYYGIVLTNLFVYAIVWQQIIKRMPLIIIVGIVLIVTEQDTQQEIEEEKEQEKEQELEYD